MRTSFATPENVHRRSDKKDIQLKSEVGWGRIGLGYLGGGKTA